MQGEDFEWDDAKATRNLLRHGVTFDTAREVFSDPAVLMLPDRSENYGEDRYRVIGMVQGRLIYVACTMRNNRIRIISARLAERREKRSYHEED